LSLPRQRSKACSIWDCQQLAKIEAVFFCRRCCFDFSPHSFLLVPVLCGPAKREYFTFRLRLCAQNARFQLRRVVITVSRQALAGQDHQIRA
jgi:hypothetical protein